jgi:PAS domain S-box-containing protein
MHITSAPPKRWRGLWIYLLLTILSFALAHYQQHRNQHDLQQRLQRVSQEISQQAEQRIRTIALGLADIRTHVLTAGASLNRPAFSRYISALPKEPLYLGARGFGFIRKVEQRQLTAFLADAQADHMPYFRLKQLGPSAENYHYIIQYIEPLAPNAAAVGLDIGSEPHRRHAAERALQSGEPQLTAPITLVQATGQQAQAFLLLLPLYRDWQVPATPEARVAQGIGWSYAPLLMHDVMRTLQFDRQQFQLVILDQGTLPPRQHLPSTQLATVIYQHPAARHSLEAQNPEVTTGTKPIAVATDTQPSYQEDTAQVASVWFGFTPDTAQHTLHVMGRNWLVQVSLNPKSVAELQLIRPWHILLLGQLCALALAFFWRFLSEKRQQQQRILSQQQTLAAIVDSAHDGIVATDVSGHILSWNDGAQRMFGYDVSQVLGRSLSQLLTPDAFMAQDQLLYSQVLYGHAVSQCVSQRRHAQGHTIDVLINIAPMRDDLGDVVALAFTFRDISAIRQQQLELTLMRDQLATAVNVAGLGIWHWRLTDNSLWWNRRMYELYGYDQEQMQAHLSYQHWLNRVHPDDRRHAEQALLTALENNEPYAPEFRIVRPDGQISYILAGAVMERDGQGKLSQVTGINVDISSQRQLEQQLRQTSAAAEAANTAKSVFLANMSHELRAPVNRILSSAALLHPMLTTSQSRELLEQTKLAADTMLSIINDILDLSKLESGHIQLQPRWEELSQRWPQLQAQLTTFLLTQPALKMQLWLRWPDVCVEQSQPPMLPLQQLWQWNGRQWHCRQPQPAEVQRLESELLLSTVMQGISAYLDAERLLQSMQYLFDVVAKLNPQSQLEWQISLEFPSLELPPSVTPTLDLTATVVSAHMVSAHVATPNSCDPVAFASPMHIDAVNMPGHQASQQASQQAWLRCCLRDLGTISVDDYQQLLQQSFAQTEVSINRRFGQAGLGIVLAKRIVTLLGGELQLSFLAHGGAQLQFDVPLLVILPPRLAAGKPSRGCDSHRDHDSSHRYSSQQHSAKTHRDDTGVARPYTAAASPSFSTERHASTPINSGESMDFEDDTQTLSRFAQHADSLRQMRDLLQVEVQRVMLLLQAAQVINAAPSTHHAIERIAADTPVDFPSIGCSSQLPDDVLLLQLASLNALAKSVGALGLADWVEQFSQRLRRGARPTPEDYGELQQLCEACRQRWAHDAGAVQHHHVIAKANGDPAALHGSASATKPDDACGDMASPATNIDDHYEHLLPSNIDDAVLAAEIVARGDESPAVAAMADSKLRHAGATVPDAMNDSMLVLPPALYQQLHQYLLEGNLALLPWLLHIGMRAQLPAVLLRHIDALDFVSASTLLPRYVKADIKATTSSTVLPSHVKGHS